MHHATPLMTSHNTEGFSQHITVQGNRIDRPGFCGAYLQGVFPGDTTVTQQGVIAGGAVLFPP
jgi:hypothetical protein